MTELADRFARIIEAAAAKHEPPAVTARRLVRALLPLPDRMLRGAIALREDEEHKRAHVHQLEGGDYKRFAEPGPAQIYDAMVAAEIDDDGGPREWPT